MARDRPVTDADIEALREDFDEQCQEIREYLASEGVDVETGDGAEARADGGDSADDS